MIGKKLKSGCRRRKVFLVFVHYKRRYAKFLNFLNRAFKQTESTPFGFFMPEEMPQETFQLPNFHELKEMI